MIVFIIRLTAYAEQNKLVTVIAIVSIAITETWIDVMIVLIGIKQEKGDMIYIKMLH